MHHQMTDGQHIGHIRPLAAWVGVRQACNCPGGSDRLFIDLKCRPDAQRRCPHQCAIGLRRQVPRQCTLRHRLARADPVSNLNTQG